MRSAVLCDPSFESPLGSVQGDATLDDIDRLPPARRINPRGHRLRERDNAVIREVWRLPCDVASRRQLRPYFRERRTSLIVTHYMLRVVGSVRATSAQLQLGLRMHLLCNEIERPKA